jgi:hypothetical protein
MNDDRQFLMTLYQDDCTQARHHETQRSTVANIVLAVSAALIGFATYDKTLSPADIVPSLLLVFLGVFGALFSAKQYERAKRHGHRAAAYRTQIAAMTQGADILTLMKDADGKTQKAFPHLSRLRLHPFWIALNAFITVTGLVMLVMTMM